MAADERGFTLIELLVAAAIGLIVMAASLDLLGVVGRRQHETQDRADTIAQVQTGVARLMREIHQAAAFNFIDSQTIDINTWTKGGEGAATLLRVRYDCSQDAECRRFEAPVGDPLPSIYTVLASGVENADVFAPKPDFLAPDYVGVTLDLAVPGAQNPIVVNDGTELPNAQT